MFSSSSSDRQAVFLKSTAAVLIGASAYWIYQSVTAYGWEGTLRLIWEGDPYPNRVRGYLDILEDVEKLLDKENTMISSLEEGLERAKLDSIHNEDPSAILRLWESNMAGLLDLQKQLGQLSYDLDKWASKVDSVPGEDEADVRKKKRKLSKRVVRLMERTDLLIKFYDSAKDATKST